MNGLGRQLTDKERIIFCALIKYPTQNDEALEKTLQDARRYAAMYADTYSLKISLAYDGLEIEI